MNNYNIVRAAAWIATGVATIFGIKYTGSAICLWAFVFPMIATL